MGEAPRKMSRKEQKKSLGAQLAVSEDDEVSIVDEIAGPSEPKVKAKTRSTKSLGAIDIIPSLPEDEHTESGKKKASEKAKPKKKYLAVKKKTSVKIDY